MWKITKEQKKIRTGQKELLSQKAKLFRRELASWPDLLFVPPLWQFLLAALEIEVDYCHPWLLIMCCKMNRRPNCLLHQLGKKPQEPSQNETSSHKQPPSQNPRIANYYQLYLASRREEDADVTDRSDGSLTCTASVGDGSDSEDNNVRVNISTEEQRWKYAIVKSMFEAIELSTETGASLGTIADLLCYACRMYYRGKNIEEYDHLMKIFWPKDWEAAKRNLKDVGWGCPWIFYLLECNT